MEGCQPNVDTKICRLAPTHRSRMTSTGVEIMTKMSSVLNVSNGSSKFEEFNLNNIEVLVDKKDQNWFQRAHIGIYLGIARIITSTTKLSEEDIRSWAFLQAEVGIYSIDSSREDAQDHDIFILLPCAHYVTVSSRKNKGNVLKKPILKTQMKNINRKF